jgi:hypothetical protein
MTIAAASVKINVMVYRVKKKKISSSLVFTPVTPVMSEIDLNNSRIQTFLKRAKAVKRRDFR